MSCNELSVVVVWPGPAISFCHGVVFLATAFCFFWFSGNRCNVL